MPQEELKQTLCSVVAEMGVKLMGVATDLSGIVSNELQTSVAVAVPVPPNVEYLHEAGGPLLLGGLQEAADEADESGHRHQGRPVRPLFFRVSLCTEILKQAGLV